MKDQQALVDRPRRMLLNAFSMNCVSHIQQGLWVRDDTRQLDYADLDPWVELAQILERGCFDALFLAETRESLSGPKSVIKDIRTQAAAQGRDPGNIRFFQGLAPIVAGTETEAKAKAAEITEQLSMDGALAHISGSLGIDLGDIDVDQALGSMPVEGMRGWVKSIVEAEPDKTKTFRDLIRARTSGRLLVGTPEQVADELQAWFDAGVDGFNVTYNTTPGTFVEFIEGVVPVLQQRGLVQREYTPGTLREKVFGRARLDGSHPGAAYRR